jgi:hypothetical protein
MLTSFTGKLHLIWKKKYSLSEYYRSFITFICLTSLLNPVLCICKFPLGFELQRPVNIFYAVCESSRSFHLEHHSSGSVRQCWEISFFLTEEKQLSRPYRFCSPLEPEADIKLNTKYSKWNLNILWNSVASKQFNLQYFWLWMVLLCFQK